MVTRFVRVKDPDTGHEVSVPERFAKAYDLKPLTDKKVLDGNGRPLPAKPHVELTRADGGDGAPETSSSPASTEFPATDTVSNTAPGSTGNETGSKAGKAGTK